MSQTQSDNSTSESDGRPRASPSERARRGDSPRQQRRTARERRQISAQIVHEAIRYEGEEELERSTAALFWSGLAAGLTMGLSLAGQGLLRSALPDTVWRPLIDSFGYTLGFLFVVAGRQQLFTENTLTPVLPVFHDRSHVRDLARLWGVVLVANLIGAFFFALVAARTSVFDPSVKRAFLEISLQTIEPAPLTLFIRAIVAGWLIALMVWLLPAAEHARMAMIVLPTYLIALAHLTHSIAGSVDVFYLLNVGAVGISAYAVFLGVSISGNVLGGVVFVALLNHKQAVAGANGGPNEDQDADDASADDASRADESLDSQGARGDGQSPGGDSTEGR